MADLNWSLTGTASGSGYTLGAPANIKDNDTGTYCEGSCTGDGGSFSYSVEIAFSESVNDINKAEIYHNFGAFCVPPGPCGGDGNWYVDLYYSGAWHQILNGSWSTESDTTVLSSSTTGWSDVTKIRLRADGSTGGNADYIVSWHKSYELRAWGPPNYSDIGIRMKTSAGIIKIGTQALDGHKLRIRKGATTYGIPLLTPGGADDSGIRIWDGSAVKALPKVD